MNQNNNQFKIATIALIVSLFSMIGVVGNFIFTLYKYKQENKILLKISPEILDKSRIKIENCDFYGAIDSEGNMISSTDSTGNFEKLSIKDIPPGYFAYPKVLVFHTLCRITNLSKTKITIENFSFSINFRKFHIDHPLLIVVFYEFRFKVQNNCRVKNNRAKHAQCHCQCNQPSKTL